MYKYINTSSNTQFVINVNAPRNNGKVSTLLCNNSILLRLYYTKLSLFVHITLYLQCISLHILRESELSATLINSLSIETPLIKVRATYILPCVCVCVYA